MIVNDIERETAATGSELDLRRTHARHGRPHTATARSRPGGTRRAASRPSRSTPTRARRTASPSCPCRTSASVSALTTDSTPPYPGGGTEIHGGASIATRRGPDASRGIVPGTDSLGGSAHGRWPNLRCPDRRVPLPLTTIIAAPDEPLKDDGRTVERSDRTGRTHDHALERRAIYSTNCISTLKHRPDAVAHQWRLAARTIFPERGADGVNRFADVLCRAGLFLLCLAGGA